MFPLTSNSNVSHVSTLYKTMRLVEAIFLVIFTTSLCSASSANTKTKSHKVGNHPSSSSQIPRIINNLDHPSNHNYNTMSNSNIPSINKPAFIETSRPSTPSTDSDSGSVSTSSTSWENTKVVEPHTGYKKVLDWRRRLYWQSCGRMPSCPW
jgi:hypothetical protein